MLDGALVVCASLGELAVVIDAQHVDRIGEADEVAPEEPWQVDLSRMFGLAPSAGGRRALALRADGRRGWALIDNDVHVRRVALSAFGSVPEWLAPAWRALNVRRVVRFDETFAYELDVVALLGGHR